MHAVQFCVCGRAAGHPRRRAGQDGGQPVQRRAPGSRHGRAAAAAPRAGQAAVAAQPAAWAKHAATGDGDAATRLARVQGRPGGRGASVAGGVLAALAVALVTAGRGVTTSASRQAQAPPHLVRRVFTMPPRRVISAAPGAVTALAVSLALHRVQRIHRGARLASLAPAPACRRQRRPWRPGRWRRLGGGCARGAGPGHPRLRCCCCRCCCRCCAQAAGPGYGLHRQGVGQLAAGVEAVFSHLVPGLHPAQR